MLKGPAIFLCFDDFHVGAWHSWLKFFDDNYFYTTDELSRTRLIYAMPVRAALGNLVVRVRGVTCWLEPGAHPTLESLVEQNMAIFLYMHDCLDRELTPLLNLNDRVIFYPMSVLDRWGRQDVEYNK